MGITVGLLIPLLGTMLGAAFVFFMKKDMSPRLQKSLLGFASGVVFAAAAQGAEGVTLASAVAVSLGIAIQNIPEGAIISMPMCAEGNSKAKSFLIGSLSGVVEPLGGLMVCS